MDVDQDTTTFTSRRRQKTESPPETSKKGEKKSDSDEPKPRIVLTFRSDKTGAKSSNMKIVSTEEKQDKDEVSPRRSSLQRRCRSAKWDSDDDNEALSPKKASQTASENDETSDNSHNPPKRSTRRRSREFDNVIANAIARKEKSYETPATSRPMRRIKPTAKILANEELRMGLETQNNARLGIQAEKSPEEGVRTRRSVRSTRQQAHDEQSEKKENKEDDNESQNQVMKLKHLCELGLKAINHESVDESPGDDIEQETEESETIEIDDEEGAEEEEEEIDDDSEVISKLLEADSDSDEDFLCNDEVSQSEAPRKPRRSARRRSSFQNNDSDRSSPVQGEDDLNAPRRRSSRRRGRGRRSPVEVQYRKRARVEESQSDPEDASNPAGGDEGSEAACPDDESTIFATCHCEMPSNVYADSEELTDPVFCQAIESVDGLRVGCSHFARKDAGGAHAAMLRAGPRAPFVLACDLHNKQMRKHMCCPACGLYCTQGTFYQCSMGHLFHLECGMPYNDAKLKPGCPHCGVYSYRWQPVNRDCCKVRVDMTCSNKKIFLPDQREQCTPAYLGFSILDPSQLDVGPLIPEDLLPSPPIDLKSLCQKLENEPSTKTSVEKLCEAILNGEGVEQLIPMIVSGKKINRQLSSLCGGTCAHAAARRGHLAALYLLQYAGADFNVQDNNLRTPLMLAVLALLDKNEEESPKKSKLNTEKDDMATEHNKEEQKTGKEATPSDDDLMKVIRYLVAAGCDVNLQGPDGMTALHMSSQHGGAEVCRVLLGSSTTDVEARDHGGWTPLVWAAENDHADVVRLLLSEGAAVCAADSEGNAVVHWCALSGAARALQLLLDAAPDAVAALNAHTDTPLHVAARQGHYACVVILLARGARTDVENSEGQLPVEVCSGQCQSAVSLNMQMSIAVSEGVARRRLLCSDISHGREQYPVPCVNETDDAVLADDFTYVTSHVTPAPLHIDYTTRSLQGCSCKNGSCTDDCSCCSLGVRRWFARGRLPAGFPYHDPPMLFECNVTCNCNAKKCTNSVITRLCQRGSVFVRAEVFRCGAARGWGLRAASRVQRGSPVAVYTGELLAVAEADTRSADQYMFALDVKPDLIQQCPDKVQLCVDSARYGGAARFINHSCRPNLAPVRVFTTTRDLRLPTVTLFATRDIAAKEEFTFDYGDKFWSVKSKWMKCECGASDCRYPTMTDETAS